MIDSFFLLVFFFFFPVAAIESHQTVEATSSFPAKTETVGRQPGRIAAACAAAEGAVADARVEAFATTPRFTWNGQKMDVVVGVRVL